MSRNEKNGDGASLNSRGTNLNIILQPDGGMPGRRPTKGARMARRYYIDKGANGGHNLGKGKAPGIVEGD